MVLEQTRHLNGRDPTTSFMLRGDAVNDSIQAASVPERTIGRVRVEDVPPCEPAEFLGRSLGQDVRRRPLPPQLRLHRLLPLPKALGLPYLFITHDLAVVSTMANKIGVLNQGVLVEEQETAKLFSEPQQDYTKMLLSSAPKIEFSS